jgi:hypothetical protein
MSAAQQAKAQRRKMRNNYAHLGNHPQRPRLKAPGERVQTKNKGK